MATILDNVQRKKEEFADNPVMVGQNIALAIAAMRDGIKSPAWEFYMTQFARDENGILDKDQLARLMATDGTLGDPVLDRKRGYMIANAMCGMSTVNNFDLGVATVDNRIRGFECAPAALAAKRAAAKKAAAAKKGTANKTAKKKSSSQKGRRKAAKK
jgi:hypothetical protein